MSYQTMNAALKYAKLGWHVFPCAEKGKAPLTPHGFKDATTDPKQISAWWSKWLDANIGVATGKISGITVLDIDFDPEKGINGFETLKQLGIGLPSTVMQRTPRGGLHLFFKYDPRVGNTANKLGPGLDTRNDGGYVVVAPSVGSNQSTYAWEDGFTPWDMN